MSKTGNRPKGLTFIELILVIALIGFLALVSIPQFRKNFNAGQLNSFSADLRYFINYLHDRAIVEGEVVSFQVNNENKECWAQMANKQGRLKTLSIPKELAIESQPDKFLLYPDGKIDKVTIKVTNADRQSVSLTTEGVFGGVKVLSK